ncbi:MAG TPA: hypothetical protein VF980_15575 [Thermoanaerobaculia bacterium]
MSHVTVRETSRLDILPAPRQKTDIWRESGRHMNVEVGKLLAAIERSHDERTRGRAVDGDDREATAELTVLVAKPAKAQQDAADPNEETLRMRLRSESLDH